LVAIGVVVGLPVWTRTLLVVVVVVVLVSLLRPVPVSVPLLQASPLQAFVS
jgi:uncharacterized membrane protein YhiD involved in acid resistance